MDRTFNWRRLQTSSRGAISDDRQGCEDNDVLSECDVLSGNSHIHPPTLLSRRIQRRAADWLTRVNPSVTARREEQDEQAVILVKRTLGATCSRVGFALCW